MTRWQLLGCGVASLCCSAALVVQAQSSTPNQSGSTASERVTLTGCIERADQLTQAATSTGTTADSQQFVLMKADAAGTSASESPAAIGTSGGIGPLYRLVGRESDLNSHVGHKVEITGTRDGTPMANAAAQAANAANPSAANAPRVRVESVKMIAETCPR